MIRRFLKTTWLVLVIAFLLAGCKLRYKKDKDVDVLARGPDDQTLVAQTDDAADVIRAAGGFGSWMNIKKLELDCVVTFYQQEGSETEPSFYLTEHHYEVYPWSNAIRISAQEPMSSFVWQLSNGQFSVLQGDESRPSKGRDEQADISPMVDFGRDFAEVILGITTAPVRLLDKSTRFLKKSRPVRVEGRWYYPIERGPQTPFFAFGEPQQTYPVESRPLEGRDEQAADVDKKQKAVEPRQIYWSKIVFFQNRDSSLVDIIWFADVDNEKFLAVRGYDYDDIVEKGVLIPAKIEIFRSDTRTIFKERLAEIRFK